MKVSRKIATGIAAVSALAILAAAAVNGAMTGGRVKVPDGFSTLVFADEFNLDGRPDSTKWNFETGYLRNGERQYYTPGNNAECKGGVLVIELRADSLELQGERCPVTSGSLTTLGLGAWKYGYVEVRAKVPSSRGLWPSIKMLPAELVYGDWPRSGEIDIMEHVGHLHDQIHFSAHTERFNHIRSTQRRLSAHAPEAVGRFHTYGLKWTADKMVWYYDGREQYAISRTAGEDWTTWPFDADFYLALSLAYGGSWGGAEGVDDGALPQRFEIDYVRVFQ